MQCNGADVVILSNDFLRNGAEIMLSGDALPPKRRRPVASPHGQRPVRGGPVSPGTPGSRQEAQFFAALDGLGAVGGPELVEGAGTVCLDGVFGNEKLRGYLAIAEAAGDQGEDFELARRDAEGLLVGGIRSEGLEGGSFRGDKDCPHHDRFAAGLATASK